MRKQITTTTEARPNQPKSTTSGRPLVSRAGENKSRGRGRGSCPTTGAVRQERMRPNCAKPKEQMRGASWPPTTQSETGGGGGGRSDAKVSRWQANVRCCWQWRHKRLAGAGRERRNLALTRSLAAGRLLALLLLLPPLAGRLDALAFTQTSDEIRSAAAAAAAVVANPTAAPANSSTASRDDKLAVTAGSVGGQFAGAPRFPLQVAAAAGAVPQASGFQWQIVCNSRCQCLVAEFWPKLDSPKFAHRAPETQLRPTNTTGGRNNNNNKQLEQPVGETLIAFSEDYTLDYDAAADGLASVQNDAAAADDDDTEQQQARASTAISPPSDWRPRLPPAERRATPAAAEPQVPDKPQQLTAGSGAAPEKRQQQDAGAASARVPPGPHGGSGELRAQVVVLANQSTGGGAEFSSARADQPPVGALGAPSSAAASPPAATVGQQRRGPNSGGDEPTPAAQFSQSANSTTPTTTESSRQSKIKPNQLEPVGQQTQVATNRSPPAPSNRKAIASLPAPSDSSAAAAAAAAELATQTGGGQQQPPAQLLYAQSLYSSNPKLSFHAHVPHYLKSQVPDDEEQKQRQPLAAVSGGIVSLHQAASRIHHQLLQQQQQRVGAGGKSGPLANEQPKQQQQLQLQLQLQVQPISGGDLKQQSAGGQIVRRLVPLRSVDVHFGSFEQMSAGEHELGDSDEHQSHPSQNHELPQIDSNKQVVAIQSSSAAAGGARIHKLAEIIHANLIKIQQDGIQSLRLRNNNLKYEHFAQLYAILALGPMRRQLFHLDLAHNSLIKLGVTFTGYIEHNLKIAATRQLQSQQQQLNKEQQPVRFTFTWPFANGHQVANYTPASIMMPNNNKNVQNSSYVDHNDDDHHHHHLLMQKTNSPDIKQQQQQQQQKLFASKQRQRYPALGDGYLFNLIVEKLIATNLDAYNNYTSPLINTTKATNTTTTTSQNHNFQPAINSLSALLFPMMIDGQPNELTTNQTNNNNNNNNNNYIQHNSYNHLHQHYQQHYLSIRALDLSYNKLKWLINDQFRVLKHLQALRLDHNKISFIHQQAFNGLEMLKYINLNSNRIQTIHVEQFQTNYNLLSLSIRANYLAYLRAGSFASLSNLKRLDLSQNKFTILSNNALVGLETVESLNLSSNQFVHVPSASLHPLSSLIKLDLSDNQLAQLVPGTFFHLPIGELWLDRNELLVAIDRGAFWDLPYLRQLHLQSNPMLMAINSQAFVGTKNLYLIDVENCPLLDLDTKQMLDNITMAATSRQLRIEQQQQQQQQQQTSTRSSSLPTPPPQPQPLSPSPVKYSSTNEQQSTSNSSVSSKQMIGANKNLTETLIATQANLKSNANLNLNANDSTTVVVSDIPPISQSIVVAWEQNQIEQLNNSNPIKGRSRDYSSSSPHSYYYYYWLGSIILLVVALKFVFSYTSTSRYLATRRRARRVYEAQPSPMAAIAGLSSLASSSCSISVANDQGGRDDAARRFSVSGRSEDALDQELEPSGNIHVISLSSFGDDVWTRQQQPTNGGLSSSEMEQADTRGANVARLNEQQRPTQQPTQDSDDNNGDTLGRHQAAAMGGDGLELGAAAGSDSGKIDDGADDEHRHLHSDVITIVERSADSAATLDPGAPSRNLGFCPGCPSATLQLQQAAAAAAAGISSNSLDSTGHESISNVNVNANAGASVANANEQAGDNEAALSCCDVGSLRSQQLVAAGLDYGHANCLHFYQSIDPALQIADLTNNYVHHHQMDYY